jgi:hypothetical protein
MTTTTFVSDVEYAEYSAVVSCADTLQESVMEACQHIIFYLSLNHRVRSATIREECTGCDNSGHKLVRSPRSKTGWKEVVCPVCHGRPPKFTMPLITSPIDNDHHIWLFDNIK